MVDGSGDDGLYRTLESNSGVKVRCIVSVPVGLFVHDYRYGGSKDVLQIGVFDQLATRGLDRRRCSECSGLVAQCSLEGPFFFDCAVLCLKRRVVKKTMEDSQAVYSRMDG